MSGFSLEGFLYFVMSCQFVLWTSWTQLNLNTAPYNYRPRIFLHSCNIFFQMEKVKSVSEHSASCLKAWLWETFTKNDLFRLFAASPEDIGTDLSCSLEKGLAPQQ